MIIDNYVSDNFYSFDERNLKNKKQFMTLLWTKKIKQDNNSR